MTICPRILQIALLLAVPTAPSPVQGATELAQAAEVQGLVRHSKTHDPVKGALVVLTCTCLTAAREMAKAINEPNCKPVMVMTGTSVFLSAWPK